MTKQKQSAPQKSVNRKDAIRYKKDEKIQRNLTLIAIAIAALIVIILSYGFVTEVIIKPQKPVAQIGDVAITVKDYQARVRHERLLLYGQTLTYQEQLTQLDTTDENEAAFAQQLQMQLDSLEQQLDSEMAVIFGGQVLDRMIEEELVRQEAAQRGLTADQNEITKYIEQMLGYDREAAAVAETETLTETAEITETQIQPTITEAEYQERYTNFKNNYLERSGLSEEAFRSVLEAELLQAELREQLGENIEAEAEQVQAAYFSASTEEATQALKARIDDGETIEDLIAELNEDEDDNTIAGELSWYPRGAVFSQIGSEVEAVAFDTPVDAASDPVIGADERYYVLYIQGHETRPLSDSLLWQRESEKYDEWLGEQKQDKVERMEWQSVTPDDFG